MSFDFQSSAAFKATTDAQREARERPATARSATLRPAVDELITLSAAAVFYSRRTVRILQVPWHKNVGKRLRIKAKPRSAEFSGITVATRPKINACEPSVEREFKTG